MKKTQKSRNPLKSSHIGWLILLSLGVVFIIGAVNSCNKDDATNPEEVTLDISNYIKNLNYDPNAMLNVQNIDGGSLKTPGNIVTNKTMENNNLIVCEDVDYNLKQNAEQVAIIRPTNGIIWPGALVKINEGLLNGMPEPVTLSPAPTTLRVDLPGIGSNGIIVINEPSNSNTQTAIDNALDWWNDNQYI